MTANWPIEQQGSTGENVRSIQYLLNDHGTALTVDGDFGLKTTAAVRAFQTHHNLTVDGIVGNQTWPALIVQVSAGSTGDAVRAVQSQIHSRSGWLTIDGIFGPETDSAVRFFQQDIGLSVDGIVGPNTWNALVLNYLRAQGGQAASQLVFQAWTEKAQLAANRAQLYRDLPEGPFYGFNRPGAKASEAIIQNWWRQGMMGGSKAHYDGIVAFSQTDFTEDLKKISVPVFVMHRDDDQIVPYADSAPLSAKLLRNATLKTYSGFPHGMPTTQAETINADLLDFLKT